MILPILQDCHGVWCAECLGYIRGPREEHHLVQQAFARSERITALTRDVTVPVHCRICHRQGMDRRATELTGILYDCLDNFSLPELEAMARRLSDGGRPIPALVFNRKILALVEKIDPGRAMVKRNHILISTSSLGSPRARQIERKILHEFAKKDAAIAARGAGINSMLGRRDRSIEFLELADALARKLPVAEREQVIPAILRERSMTFLSIDAAEEAAKLLSGDSHPANTIRLHKMLIAAAHSGSDRRRLYRARDYHVEFVSHQNLSLTYQAYGWMFEYATNPMATSGEREKAYKDLIRAQYLVGMLGVANLKHLLQALYPAQRQTGWKGSWSSPTQALVEDPRLKFRRARHVELRREALPKHGPGTLWQIAQRPWQVHLN